MATQRESSCADSSAVVRILKGFHIVKGRHQSSPLQRIDQYSDTHRATQRNYISAQSARTSKAARTTVVTTVGKVFEACSLTAKTFINWVSVSDSVAL